MPNRDHDDAPYNRNEGRFESPRDEREDYRNESLRSSRDWNRSDHRGGDYRTGERSRYGNQYGSGNQYGGNQYGSGYNPSRDDNDYRGGSRHEDRSAQSDFGRWDEDARWREQLTQRTGYPRSEWTAASEHNRGWGDQHTLRGGWANQRQPYGGNFGSQGNYGAQGNYGSQGNFGGGQEWNRDYTRDWDRDYARDRAARFDSQQRDDNDWGDQLRHSTRQVIGKVKRAFRGPKGYKRSDERIREDVNDRLAQQDEFDPSEIEIRVENGDVTLTGSVRSRHEKFRAEEIADDVSGVNDVHNQLRLGSQPQQQTGAANPTTSPSTAQTSRNGRA